MHSDNFFSIKRKSPKSNESHSGTIRVRTFASKSWLSSQAFGRRRENWWQVLSLHSFAKQILAISSAVHGFHPRLPSLFHVYKDIWKPSIGDNLACEREFDNCFDKFAIKVVNNGETVGHLPRKFSKIAWCRFDFILVFSGWFMENYRFFSRCSRR